MCIDMRIDTCIAVYEDMRIDMRVDMRTDMCIDSSCLDSMRTVKAAPVPLISNVISRHIFDVVLAHLLMLFLDSSRGYF